MPKAAGWMVEGRETAEAERVVARWVVGAWVMVAWAGAARAVVLWAVEA